MIKYVFDNGVKIVIFMFYFGCFNGVVNQKYFFKLVVVEFEKQFGGKKVIFVFDCVGFEVEEIVNKVEDGVVVLFENLCFYIEEEGSVKDKDGNKIKVDKVVVEEFCKGLIVFGDIYISEYLLIDKVLRVYIY